MCSVERKSTPLRIRGLGVYEFRRPQNSTGKKRRVSNVKDDNGRYQGGDKKIEAAP